MKLTFGNMIENKSYQLRKCAYAIIFNTTKNKVLTVHNGKDFHFLPGGGIEGDESDKECIEREMLEETGYRATVGSFVANAEYYFISSKNEYLISDGNFYLAELGEKVQEPIELNHLTEWLPIDDIEKHFFYKHQIWAIKQAVERMGR